MRKVLSIIIEHFHEKKWTFLMFGVLMGFFGFVMTLFPNILDLASLEDFLDFLPEEFLDFFGGFENFASPYGFLNLEVFAFYWIFVGFFVVYIASSTILPGEVEDKTIDLILSKPISRSSYLMGKITFLYLFIMGVLAIIFGLIGVGMLNSQAFIDYGLYWDRLLAVYVMNIVHSGTLAMTALLFATITLNTKKTTAAGLGIMFVMFIIGTFWGLFPEEQQVIKYISTWFYLGTEDLFVHGILDNFLRNILVLVGVNVVLIVASLLVFRCRDIPV